MILAATTLGAVVARELAEDLIARAIPAAALMTAPSALGRAARPRRSPNCPGNRRFLTAGTAARAARLSASAVAGRRGQALCCGPGSRPSAGGLLVNARDRTSSRVTAAADAVRRLRGKRVASIDA
jgi:hypothetical protein